MITLIMMLNNIMQYIRLFGWRERRRGGEGGRFKEVNVHFDFFLISLLSKQ